MRSARREATPAAGQVAGQTVGQTGMRALSRLELESVDDALASAGARVDPAPAGKTQEIWITDISWRDAATDATWDRVAQCESTGNWSINTGNGFSGGLQFTPSTWRAFGGGQFAPMAYQASRAQQIVVAELASVAELPFGWGGG